MGSGQNQALVPQTSGVILAGGASRRMGRDKRTLRLWGENGPTLLERTVATLAPLCSEVVVVLNDPEQWQHLEARLAGDQYADGGALGGIYSGLAACSDEYALVVGCDMPLLNAALLVAMLSSERGYDVLAPRSPTPGATRNRLELEPLHTIYRKTCLAPMREALDAGRLQIAGLFSALHVRPIDAEELARYDPHGHSFLNLNTAEQLADVQQLVGSQNAAA